MGFNKTWDSNWFINSYTKLIPPSPVESVTKSSSHEDHNFRKYQKKTTYSFFLHQDFLIRNYLNLIYSNSSSDPLISNLLLNQKKNFSRSSSLFIRQQFPKSKWTNTEAIISQTLWTQPIKHYLYHFPYNKNLMLDPLVFKGDNNQHSSKFSSFIKNTWNQLENNSQNTINLDKLTLLNYNKLYISFLLNKQKYNIKIMLFILNSIYEIRKRLNIINQSLLFFSFSNNCIKQHKQLPQPFFFFTQDSFKNIHKQRLRFTRNFCLKINYKDTKVIFSSEMFSFRSVKQLPFQNTSLSRIGTENVSDQFVDMVCLRDLLSKIAHSIEKSYWIKYKLNIQWILHNKNLYYLKTKIYNLNQINTGFILRLDKISTNSSNLINDFAPYSVVHLKSNGIPSILGNILKILFVIEPTLSQQIDWFKNKKINICFYYLHLIYTKLFTINLWKYFLSLRDFKLHKNYNKLILNEILKPLISQLYLRFDRFLLYSCFVPLSPFFVAESLPFGSKTKGGAAEKNNLNLTNKGLLNFENYVPFLLGSYLFFASQHEPKSNKDLINFLSRLFSHSSQTNTVQKRQQEGSQFYKTITLTNWYNLENNKIQQHPLIQIPTIYNNFSASTPLKGGKEETPSNSIEFNVSLKSTVSKLTSISSEISGPSFKMADIPFFTGVSNYHFSFKENDIFYIFIQNFLENLYLLKNISFNLLLGVTYLPFNLNTLGSASIATDSNGILSGGDDQPSITTSGYMDDNKSKLITQPMLLRSGDTERYTNLSYFIKPLNLYNFNNSSHLFDTHFQRNSFYLSKVKDLSNPLLHFDFSSFYPLSNLTSKNNPSLERQKDGPQKKDGLSNIVPTQTQKKLSSIQVDNGPRIRIKKSIWKTQIEWALSLGSRSDGVNQYKTLLNKSSNDILSRFFSTSNTNFQHKYFNNRKFIENSEDFFRQEQDSFVTKNYNLNLDFITFEGITLDHSDDARRNSLFFSLKRENAIFYPLYGTDEKNDRNNGEKLNNHNLKFLPLPKAPRNEIIYQYLRKYVSFSEKGAGYKSTALVLPHLNEKSVEFSIKHYYSKTFNAYTLIENLSRFLISFIKKNKGGKNKFQQLKNITYKVLQFLIHNQFHGVAFSFSGRVYGAKKGMSFKMLFGSVPFSTLTQNIDYAKLMQKTRNGTWGFQIWLHLKGKKTRLVLPFKTFDSRPSSVSYLQE